jgi:hypothetical protein
MLDDLGDSEGTDGKPEPATRAEDQFVVCRSTCRHQIESTHVKLANLVGDGTLSCYFESMNEVVGLTVPLDELDAVSVFKASSLLGHLSSNVVVVRDVDSGWCYCCHMLLLLLLAGAYTPVYKTNLSLSLLVIFSHLL